MEAVPISTLFIGINGFIALVLSYIVVMERIRTRVWHGESKEDVTLQLDPLANPTAWVSTVEKISPTATVDQGALQRKVRAHGNFSEYVPLGLLFIVTLELMNTSNQLVWLLGTTLTIARIAYAYGVITTYGPSIGRAVGFFGTWFVYLVGASACVYYGLQGVI